MTETFERKLDARLVLSVAAAGIMSFSGVVVETSMNIAFPSLMEEFGVSTATVQWITTGYLLVLAIIMPLSAFLKRRFKTKSLFVTALLLFFTGTVVCAAAPSFGFLITGRIIQGLGTGIALPLMYNIVIEQAPFDKMGTMMGIATLITAVAPAVGPSLGGLILSVAGWRMIFIVLLPLLVVSFFMGVYAIRQASPTEKASFSVLQFLTLAASFACLVFATSSASTEGWASAQVWGLIAAFVVLLVLFYFEARNSKNPLIHVDIFSNPCFTLSVVYIVLFQSIVLSLGYLIPNYAQMSCDFGEFASGCLLLPGCIVGAILAPFGGRILDAFGAKRPIIFGACAQLLAMILFAAVGLKGAAMVLAVIYILIAVGQGFSMPNSITNGLSYLSESRKTDGNATFNTLQQLGGAMGTSIATSIVNAAQTGATDMAVATATGVQQAFYVFAGVSVLSVVCCVLVFVIAARRRNPNSVVRPR